MHVFDVDDPWALEFRGRPSKANDGWTMARNVRQDCFGRGGWCMLGVTTKLHSINTSRNGRSFWDMGVPVKDLPCGTRAAFGE